MSEIAKRALLKIKKQGQIYDLFVKSNARNVECFDAEGNKVSLYKVLVDIYNKFTSNDLDNEAKIKELRRQIDFIIENADTDAIDSLKEVAKWIKDHEAEYAALEKLTDGLGEKTVASYIADAISASETTTNAKISQIASDLATAQNTLQSNIDAVKKEFSAEIKKKVPDNEADNGSVLVTRNGVTSWEDLIEIVDSNNLDVSTMQEGHLYCVMLEDDPIEANQDNILEAMAESDNIVLTDNVTLPAGTVYDGTIDAQGYTITLKG